LKNSSLSFLKRRWNEPARLIPGCAKPPVPLIERSAIEKLVVASIVSPSVMRRSH
jgi:hypothetical protein